MDAQAIGWAVFAGGLLTGGLFRLRGVLVLGLLAVALLVGGFALGAVSSDQRLVWLFGVALMALPLLGGAYAVGGLVGIALSWLAIRILRLP